MKTFLIVALPRCRTAWLANFLTYGPATCFHEPMAEHAIEDYPKLLASAGTEYVGISDSLNGIYFDKIREVLPSEPKIVIVRRPMIEVARSLKAIGFSNVSGLTRMQKALEQVAVDFRHLEVDYYDLDARAIWDYVLPEVPFNKTRAEMLENFQLVVPPNILIERGLKLFLKRGGLILSGLAP